MNNARTEWVALRCVGLRCLAWRGVQRAQLNRRLVLQLQSRELGPDDYALLQQLDRPTIVSMWDHLTAALSNPGSVSE